MSNIEIKVPPQAKTYIFTPLTNRYQNSIQLNIIQQALKIPKTPLQIPQSTSGRNQKKQSEAQLPKNKNSEIIKINSERQDNHFIQDEQKFKISPNVAKNNQQQQAAEPQANNILVIKSSMHCQSNKCTLFCSILRNEFKYQGQQDLGSKVVKYLQYKQNFEFQGKQTCSVVMPFAKNGDLYQYYQKNHQTMSKFDAFCEIFGQIAECVKNLHDKDITHNDIKGDNFLVYNTDVKNNKYDIRLCDFGLATQQKHKNLSAKEQKKMFSQKNIQFISPEFQNLIQKFKSMSSLQQLEHPSLDQKAQDVYFVGKMMFEVYFQIPLDQMTQNEKKTQYFENKNFPEFFQKWEKVENYLNQYYDPNCLNQQYKKLAIMEIISDSLQRNPEQRIQISEIVQFFNQYRKQD